MNTDPPCTPETVSWCYRIFLGRDPENTFVVEEKLQRMKVFADIRREFLISPEFFSDAAVQRRAAMPASPEVCAWAARLVLGTKPSTAILTELVRLASLNEVLQTLRHQTVARRNLPAVSSVESCKVVLLGNCQTDSLRVLLQHYTRWQVVNWREHVLIDSSTEQIRIRHELTRADIVITHQLVVDRYGVLGTDDLILAGIPLIVIPNLYFAGPYPEMIYVGTLGQRLQSPLGDYHSALAIAAFLAGLKPEDALACFDNDALFSQTGLLDVWTANWSEYLARELKCDIKMADYLDAGIRSRPLFYAINHPVGAVMDELVRRIIYHITGEQIVPQFMRDEFQNNVIYPVWGPIVRHQGLEYVSPAGFYLPTPKGFLPLLDYLHQVYDRYTKDLDGIELPLQVLRLRDAILNIDRRTT